MPDEETAIPAKPKIDLSIESSCFACSPNNPRGLRLNFVQNEQNEATAEWTPDKTLEGFPGIIHGGILTTVLDESMAKAVIAAGADALTAELRIRLRQHVAPGQTVHVRGWIASRNRRMIQTEATLEALDGSELAHAWATFLVVR